MSSAPPSKGLGWAFAMLGLQLVEVLALTEVVFRDQDHFSEGSANPWVRLYFALVAASFAIQACGILLVYGERYRAGGVLQIIASSIHVPKAEGLIGIVGGLKAYRYPRRVAEVGDAGAAEPVVTA